MFFIAMQTAERRHFPITEIRISPDHLCARFCGKYPLLPMSSWNCSKNFSSEKATQGGNIPPAQTQDVSMNSTHRPRRHAAPTRPSPNTTGDSWLTFNIFMSYLGEVPKAGGFHRPLSIVCAGSASNNPSTCEPQTASPASDILPERASSPADPRHSLQSSVTARAIAYWCISQRESAFSKPSLQGKTDRSTRASLR